MFLEEEGCGDPWSSFKNKFDLSLKLPLSIFLKNFNKKCKVSYKIEIQLFLYWWNFRGNFRAGEEEGFILAPFSIENLNFQDSLEFKLFYEKKNKRGLL